jgi:ligand-binding sensor domain-containing protein
MALRFRKFGPARWPSLSPDHALAETRTAALWVGTSGGGVSRWDGGRFTSFDEFPAGYEVIALAADRDGSVWIGTDKGLIQATGNTFKSSWARRKCLPRTQVRALLQDSRGVLWVSFVWKGLYRRGGRRFAPPIEAKTNPRAVYAWRRTRMAPVWAGSEVLWKWSAEVVAKR